MTSTLELTDLEELVNEDSVKCESTHRHLSLFPGGEICLVEVVARKFICDRAFNICASSRDWNLNIINTHLGNYLCEGCGRPIKKCWKVIDI